ncbi:MAG: ImmA/IrrE family metallo-endopeptidase [Limisphaerales bacterium]
MRLNLHEVPALEAGDANQFAVRVEFIPNLDPGFATPEEDLSWGRLQIWAGGRNLCEHVDRGEVRKALEWYLLPTLEWFASAWDFLLHEQRCPVSNSGETAWQSLAQTNRPERFDRPSSWDFEADQINAAWTANHCLRASRCGGLFPDVVIRRWWHEVELSWGESALAGAPAGFRFLHGSGKARIPPEALARPLYEVLKRAAQELAAEQTESSRLKGLLAEIQRVARPDRQLARTALLAGLGQRQENWLRRWEDLRGKLAAQLPESREAIEQWFEPSGDSPLCVSGSCEAAVMFGSASPTLKETDVLTLATHLVNASGKKPSARWTALMGGPEPLRAFESPWSGGYRLAQEWAERAGIRHKRDESVDIEEHLERMGVGVAEIELEDVGTAGLAVYPDQGAPQIFVNRRNPRCQFPSGKRFILAHELCHLLHDRARGQNLAILSGPWAPKELEQRANAFAAALLMPSDLLKRGLYGRADDLEFSGLLALAQRLHVSPDALAHHLANCGLITEITRDILLAQLANRSETESGTKSRYADKPRRE